MLKTQWLQIVQLQLALFAAQDDFYLVMVTAFGDRLDQQKLQNLRQEWLGGNFTIIPEIQVLSQGELGSNNGAYSAELDRIFVSSDFLTANQGDSGAITNLLLEELGHKLDQFLNGGIDSAGDEGAIFADLSQGKTLSNQELINLKAEDDHRIITVDGQQIAVELQSWNGTPGNDNYVGTIDSDQAYGGEGNDILNGGAGNDYLYGEGGNDSLIGGDGNDVLSGWDGVDTFNGGNGDDQLDSSFRPSNGEIYIGGAGNDYASLSSGASGITITYTDFNNGTITGGGIIREVESIGFYGGNGNNIITITAATASLYGGEGTDNMTTGASNDQIYARGGDDTLRGGAGIDGLQGEGGNDQIYGDAGNDNISGGEGNDTVNGGLDNDQIYGDGGNDLLNGDEGNDVLIGGNGIDTLNGGSGNDQLGSNFQASNGETFIGGDGTDTATLGSDATGITITYTNINGGTITGGGIIKEIENFNFNGGTGNDIVNASAATYAALSGGDGNDTLTTGLENDQLYGDAGNDSLSAGSGNDGLRGGVGNDSLNGGVGNDYLEGGAGNDSYLIDADVDLGQKTIYEYETLDSIDIFDFRATSTVIAMNLSLTTTQTIAAGVQVSMSYAMIESALGGSGNDLLMGNSLNNNLQGNGGNDSLDGGTGIDTLQGGLGDDTYTIDTITDTLTEALNEGTDTVKSSVTYTLGANLENLLLTGSTAIDGTGNILNNNITGNGANNILNGGTGIDTLIGSSGDDIYLVDTTTDTLTEALNQGTDTVQSSVTYTLGVNLENLTLTGSSDINGTGNALNNIITGNGANNTLAGGAGINTLIGGLGNDIYLVDTTTDTLTEALNQGTDTVQSSVTFILGTNLENLILTGFTAINGTGNTLNNTLTGNNASNFLNGLSGNDTLNGGDGNDTYIIDADVDLGIDTINETATGGQLDYLDFRTTSIGVTVNLGLTTLQTVATGVQLVIPVVAIESVYGGSGNDALTGGQGSNELYGYDGNDSLSGDAGNDFFFGWNGDDSLNGGSGDDLFYGDTGNDTLYGGTGNDTLNGGYGNDTYLIDADVDLGIDTINDNSAFGTDIIDFRNTTTKAITLNLGLTTTQTVATGVQLIMPVANLASVYGGTGNDNLTGNNLVNYLMGGIGNDTLAGGEGNDIYLIDADVDTGIDSIIETGGIDTLDFRSTTTKGVTVNLAINATPLVQTIAPGVQLSMSTTPIEYVYGGTGNDNITGNNSDNYLIGGIGNDSLTGGFGNDTYVIDADVDTGTDSIIETATGAIDTLNFSSTTTKAITLNLGTTIVQTIATGVQLTMPTGAIEDVYGGTGNDNLTGNTLNNRLYGLSGNNQLFGLSGNDQLYGGSGNDTLTGGDGNDSLYGYGGDDLLNGGNGVDSFYFKITGLFLGSALTGNKTVANIFGRDTISDFTVGVDKIILSKSNFTAITSAVGTSIGTNFSKVANELSVDTQFASIVYCQGNGNLYYNQNGNAIGLGTNGGNLAVLTGLPALTANDFVIVA